MANKDIENQTRYNRYGDYTNTIKEGKSMKKKNETICLIMGILAIVTCWILVGSIFGIIGIVFFVKCKRDGLFSKKPIVGIVLSVISILFVILLWLYTPNESAPSNNSEPQAEVSVEDNSEQQSEIASDDDSEQQSEDNTEIPEANTSEMVDYIASEAKKSANEAATEEKRDEAINYIYENYPDYFKDNDTMEKTMYYGYYLEYAYAKNGEDNIYANLGMDAYQAVKYVYRGSETTDDDHVTANLEQIKDSLSELGYTVE